MGEEVRIEREVGFGVRLTRENEGLVQGKPQGWVWKVRVNSVWGKIGWRGV